MIDLLVASALLLSLQAPAAPPPASTAAAAELVPEPPPPSRSEGEALLDEASPPPGSPAEVALWKAGVEATHAIWHSRAAAAALQHRANGLKLLARLEAAVKRADHEAAERLAAVRSRLDKAWRDDVETFKRRWPIDTYRGCGYPHLYFDSAMRVAPGPSRRAEVEAARVDLKACVDRAGVATRAMVAANQAFGAAIEEALRTLEPAEAGAAAAAPAPEGKDAHERREAEERREQHERGERKDRERTEKHGQAD